MDPWSSTYKPYASSGGLGSSGGRSMEITVRKTSKKQSMFVGTSHHEPGPTRRAWDIAPSEPAKKSSVGSWWNDPEMKRKRRVAKYKLYAAEGKVKSSFKNGFRWLRRKCSKIVRH